MEEGMHLGMNERGPGNTTNVGYQECVDRGYWCCWYLHRILPYKISVTSWAGIERRNHLWVYGRSSFDVTLWLSLWVEGLRLDRKREKGQKVEQGNLLLEWIVIMGQKSVSCFFLFPSLFPHEFCCSFAGNPSLRHTFELCSLSLNVNGYLFSIGGGNVKSNEKATRKDNIEEESKSAQTMTQIVWRPRNIYVIRCCCSDGSSFEAI